MNQLRLSARLVEAAALRYTPAGLPALDVQLEHVSEVQALGQPRQVRLMLKALALGAVAERLARQAIGSQWLVEGYLASPRQGRQVVLHIQNFQQDPFQGAS